MYVYADVIFFINFVMNSVILLLTAWTADIKYKVWRILLSATVGSCYVLISLLPGMLMMAHFWFKMLMAFSLILLAFGFQPRRIIFLLVAFFYVISFILGGSVVGWLYFGQTSYYLGNSIILTNLSWTHLLWGSLLGISLVMIVVRRMIVRATRHSHLYQVILEYEKRRIELTAMLDTGNGLYTLIDRKPVILVNQHAIEPLLSQQVKYFLQNHSPETWLSNLNECMDLVWLSRVQIIPYHSIGHKSMLLAFRLDYFMITGKGGDIDIGDVMIGIYSGTLSGDGAYDVLLHPQIMNKLSKKEEVSICA
ncbi:sigma-E processing peptidase SpoIIGA [Pelosinus sp. sgz500959]|uniref:sigma-E processing peptidase SpoIIGA n=1 Tax=Pelosinus sp. sgz500959 TaxID=3242472 RepID=UPI003671ED54